MNYQQTLDYFYNQLPMFQRIGSAAYKDNLDNTIALCKLLGNPENKFKSVHIAGTNGKGSTSHLLASILQSAGFKVGLYTSPHLKDFRERIKINGEMIPQQFVVDFVETYKTDFDQIKPSFFEMTVGLAFDYFVSQQIDIAIIEVGLGGRLDSTNVIKPELSVITNISFDHTALLGDTLEKIAAEKAGIIKPGIPVIIGETQVEIKNIFLEKAKQNSIKEFGSDYTQNRYEKIAQRGLWESEEILVNKYFMRKSKILDIGCGSGRTTFPLFEKGFNVIGIDITPEMIDIAKKIALSKNLQIDFRIGDATKLEFPDNYFDGAIFANNGWVQIPGNENRQKALN